MGLFLLPTFIAFLQAWAINRIAAQLSAGSLLVDGRLYIEHAVQLQNEPATLLRMLELGLYPLFLSQFDLGIRDWSIAGSDPKVLAIYSAQLIGLSATSALFLVAVFILLPGSVLRRTFISLLLGAILLSPLVIVWPNTVLTEAMAVPAILIFVCACAANDARGSWALILVAVACCVLVLARDAMMFFVLIFAVLLLANICVAKFKWTRATVIGALLVLAGVTLGAVKASLVAGGISKDLSQLLANTIQFRILPHPEHRNFFTERGLPISSDIMARSGKPAWVDNDWFEPASELADRPDFVAYREWVRTKGAQTYLAFLLRHPGYLLRSIAFNPSVVDKSYAHVQDLHFSITDLMSVPYGEYRTQLAPYPQWLGNWLLTPFGWLIPSIYIVVVTVHYVWQTASRRRAPSLEIAAIAAGGAILINYHIDAWGLWPHTVPYLLLIYIAMIIGVVPITRRLVQWASFASDYRRFPRNTPILLKYAGVAIIILGILPQTPMKSTFIHESNKPTAVVPTSEVAKRATEESELPPLAGSPFGPARWDLIEGLNAELVNEPAVVTNQRILRLVAAGADGRHALGAHFVNLAPGEVYRAIVWLKAVPNARVMIEARDAVDHATGKPSNYGVAKFHLASHTTLSSAGDIFDSGVEAADGWLKVWVELRSKDGQVFALIGLLENRNNRHVFTARGQEVTFGGFEIFPRQVGSSNPGVIKQDTGISPKFPGLAAGSDR